MPACLRSTPHALPSRQPLTAADLKAYERRYNLRHRFYLPADRRSDHEQAVVAGRVDERQPEQGFQIVGSDLAIYHTYEAHARRDAPAHLSVIVVLEGCAELELGAEHRAVTAGDGLLLAHDGRQPLCARHVAQPRVRAVNVTVTASAAAQDPRLASLRPLIERAPALAAVRLPAGLRQSLASWLQDAPDGADALLAEGQALQLLAQGAAQHPARVGPSVDPLSPRDRQLLGRVRAHLEDHPAEAHSLSALADLACMSPSSLREKFRLAHGRSVFDHLREVRLARAHRYLAEGHSVQQAASRVGYRHPTNFATAFRKRFGVAPSAVR
jgi:AraC-like DNA-binding protein